APPAPRRRSRGSCGTMASYGAGVFRWPSASETRAAPAILPAATSLYLRPPSASVETDQVRTWPIPREERLNWGEEHESSGRQRGPVNTQKLGERVRAVAGGGAGRGGGGPHRRKWA